MDFLSLFKIFIKKNFFFLVLFLFACFSVGIYFKFVSLSIDSPLEQLSEEFLRQNGIDIDFSKEKKESESRIKNL